MSKTFYIHGGYGKTGTSAIQATLWADRSRLEQQGACYLGRDLGRLADLPHIDEIIRVARNRNTARRLEVSRAIADQLLAFDRKTNFSKYVWSFESLSDNVECAEFVGLVAAALQPTMQAHGILFIRKQDDFFSSAYHQWGIKHKTAKGPVPEFQDFFSLYSNWGHYLDIIRAWRQALSGNVTCYGYEKGKSVGQLYSACGLGDPPTPEVVVYATPPGTILSLYKLFNSQFDEQVLPDALGNFLARSGLETRDFRPVDWKVRGPTLEQRAEILRLYKEHNETLKAETGIDFAGNPTPASSDEPADASRLFAALLFALVDMSEKVEALSREVRALRGDAAPHLDRRRA